MSFPSYSSYSDRGIDWLGQVPADWRTRPLWSLFRRIKRTDCADEELLSVYRDYGVVRKSDRNDNFNNASEDLSAYQLVCQGDLAINKMKAWQGSVAISSLKGIVSPAYFIYDKLHSENDRYLHYLMRCDVYVSVYRSISKGIRPNQWDLDPDYHTHLPILLPPPAEQTAIATFLDRETAKIDALVDEQRRLMALLKEKRQAVISHAVTKGLNPDAPMKDSGVELLDEVPAHWASSKIKHETSHVVDCLHTTPTYEGDLLFPAIRTADIEPGRLLLDQVRLVSQDVFEDRVQRLEPIAGDILYSREGERFGMAALVPENVKLCLGQRMMMFRAHPHVCSKYLMWALNSDAILRQVDLATGGSTSPHINISDIINFDMPIPPRWEQVEISSYIELRVDRLDGAIATARSAVALLSERRAALISSAVTGKIDVRGSATVLPFPVDRTRARRLIAAEIIDRSAHRATFGRVKLQKIAYLAEAHAGVTELEGAYLREAAGPLDWDMIHEMEREAGALAGVRVEQPDGVGSAVTYRLGDRRGAHRQDLAALLGGRTAKFDKLVEDIGTIETKGAEAVATLYAVWNDALIDGETPTDMEIKLAVLSEWHPEKTEKFTINDLQIWLDWMRRHGLVPTGAGPKTTTGRLFA